MLITYESYMTKYAEVTMETNNNWVALGLNSMQQMVRDFFTLFSISISPHKISPSYRKHNSVHMVIKFAQITYFENMYNQLANGP